MNNNENVISRVLGIIFYSLLPKKWHEEAKRRLDHTKKAFTSNLELRIFWRVLFFPIVLPVSLLTAIIKVILYWMFPNHYGYWGYIIKQMYTDIVKEKRGWKLTKKRAVLCYELFTKGAEKHISCGEDNPDKTFYVIRPYYYLEPNEFIFSNVANLLTQYYYSLQKLSYAVEHGWIPVVDWEHYGRMPHSEDYPVNGTNNAWDYYWQQPSEFSLNEVYRSKNVILSTQNIGQFGYIPNCAMKPPFKNYAEDLVRRCPQYASLIPFNDITQDYIDEKYNELFKEGTRILGVVVRGASYGRNETPYRSHPVQVGMRELIKSVKIFYEEWNMDYIFFVNEMQELVDAMKAEFGDRLIVLPRMRDHVDRPTDGITKNPMYYPGNRYQTNLDYVTEIALLSKCTSLVGSMSSGMRSALIWNAGDYEDVYIFDKGLW